MSQWGPQTACVSVLVIHYWLYQHIDSGILITKIEHTHAHTAHEHTVRISMSYLRWVKVRCHIGCHICCKWKRSALTDRGWGERKGGEDEEGKDIVCACRCECWDGVGNEGKRGMQWEGDVNKMLLLSGVVPPGVLSEGYDDRGRLRAQAVHWTVCVCVGGGITALANTGHGAVIMGPRDFWCLQGLAEHTHNSHIHTKAHVCYWYLPAVHDSTRHKYEWFHSR